MKDLMFLNQKADFLKKGGTDFTFDEKEYRRTHYSNVNRTAWNF